MKDKLPYGWMPNIYGENLKKAEKLIEIMGRVWRGEYEK